MDSGSDRFTRLMAVISLPLLLPLALILGWFQRPVPRTRAEVADLLEREADQCASDAEWDDFICLRIADPDLEAIRASIVRAEEAASLSPERLRKWAAQLRRV